MITPLLISLIVVALVAYLVERALPQYAHAIRIVACIIVALVLARFVGLL